MFTPVRFQGLRDQLLFGKRLPGAIYVARVGLSELGEHRRWTEALAQRHGLDPQRYTVHKWHRDAPKLSFLAYPGLFGEPHPVLAESVLVDLAANSISTTVFSPDGNPPILHRCEELVPLDFPGVAVFRQLTRSEERFGLYQQTQRIGFRDSWRELLAARGLVAQGFSLELVPHAPRPVGVAVVDWPFERQRTAMRRVSMSMPVSTLLARGLLKPGDRFFDYGCGHGYDVEAVRQAGYEAEGWDPCHRPWIPKQEAEVVHCGYVLNVVEDPGERSAIIREAWSLTRSVLCVAVRVRAEDQPAIGVPWGDGELTRLGTFQRYFTPEELPGWLGTVLDAPVFALAPGLAVVVRDAGMIHEVLARRIRITSGKPTRALASDSVEMDQPTLGVHQTVPTRRLGSRQQAIRNVLEIVDPTLRELGRPPRREELTLPDEASALGLGLMAIWKQWVAWIGEVALAKITEQRTSDTVVYLAMAHFGRLPRLAELSPRLRADIEVFLGGMQGALRQARQCLDQMGKPAEIARLCQIFGQGVEDAQALYVHRSLIPALPPVLRCLVGCAEVLGAPVAEADVIKIHKTSRKVTLLMYQDFSTRALPALVERIKIDLRARRVMVFDHRSEPRQLLYDKDLYMADTDPARAEWQEASERLGALIGPVVGRGPDHRELRVRLLAVGADANSWAPEEFPAPARDDGDEEPAPVPDSDGSGNHLVDQASP